MYIVIIGCGRMGSLLANRLSKQGESIVVVDKNESAFENLSAEFSGFHILGDGAEVDVLKQAKIEKADVVLATTKEDNLNLMIAQIAKEIFGVHKVLVRLFDTKREEIFSTFHIESISPTRIAVDEFLKKINLKGS